MELSYGKFYHQSKYAANDHIKMSQINLMQDQGLQNPTAWYTEGWHIKCYQRQHL